MRILLAHVAALLLLSVNPVLAQESQPAPTGNRWLDECNTGQKAGCNNYAISLMSKKDFAGAQKYFERACELGSQNGCTNAQNYASHRQTLASRVSSSSSASELQSACAKGDSYACSLHAYKLGAAKNWNEAIPYAQKGCQLGDQAACENAGKFTRNKAIDDEHAQRQAQNQTQQRQQVEQRRPTDYTIPESSYSDANVSGRRNSGSGGYVGSGSGNNSSSYKPRQQVCTERYTSGSGSNSGQRIVTCR